MEKLYSCFPPDEPPRTGLTNQEITAAFRLPIFPIDQPISLRFPVVAADARRFAAVGCPRFPLKGNRRGAARYWPARILGVINPM
jgi:hypothetical protein